MTQWFPVIRRNVFHFLRILEWVKGLGSKECAWLWWQDGSGVKALPTKPDDQISMPRTCMVEDECWLFRCVWRHICTQTCAWVYLVEKCRSSTRKILEVPFSWPSGVGAEEALNDCARSRLNPEWMYVVDMGTAMSRIPDASDPQKWLSLPHIQS